jgi:ferric-dicitrate binding protein FerR (iron transport regulator)
MRENIDEIIVRVLDQRQSTQEMRIFLDWYNAADENKQLFFQLKDIYERRKGGLYPDDREISACWERLSLKMEREQSMLSVSRALIAVRSLVAAVALVLIISGIFLFVNPQEEVTWTEVRTTPRSTPRSIVLSDGSTVLLNASSWLKYPEKFTGKNREVYLDGEALFTVARNERRSFIVHTDRQEIQVLGTQFNVQGYSSDPRTITTLITGKVKLATYDNNHQAKNELMMHPNQQVFFDKLRNEASVSEIDPNDAVTWIKGVYSFRDASLEEITRRLEKVLGISFIITDDADRIEKYTGKFFSHQSPQEVAAVLNFKGQFRPEFRNDTLFLLKK